MLCETKNKRRVFCSNRCQESFYVGLKQGDINDPDMIGLESSDGILFKIQLRDAVEFKTLAALIEDLGPDSFIPLPNIDGDTIRILFTMVRDFYNGYEITKTKTADENLKLAFALVYLDNTSLLFKFLRRQTNFLQVILDTDGPWLMLLKDILPLIFVASSKWKQKQIIELFKKLPKEQVLMRDACMYFWKILGIEKEDLLKFFAKNQRDLSVVRYFVEEEKIYLNQLLEIAVNQENRPLFNYVLSKEQLLTQSAISTAIDEADSITFLDDLLNVVTVDTYVVFSLIRNAKRSKFEQGENPLLFFYLIKQLVAKNALIHDSGKKCVATAFYVAADYGWIDIVKFILSLKEPIFRDSVIFYPHIVKNEECMAAILQDERCRLSDSDFWSKNLKSNNFMQFVFNSPLLKKQAIKFIEKAIESGFLFQDDLETWQTLYRFYPEFLQRFEANQLFMVQNLDVAVFFSEKVK